MKEINMKFNIVYNQQPLYSLGGWVKEDLEWSYTDQQGHVHNYIDGKTPTLEYIPPIVEEYYRDREVEEVEIEPEKYKCKYCGELIKLGTYIDTGPIMIDLPPTYYINDEQVTRITFEKALKDATGKDG